VAVARKLLIAVWHVLTDGCADRYADPEKVAFSLFRFAYRVGVSNLPGDVSALQYTRDQLDRLAIGADLTAIPNGTKRSKLPKSRLAPDGAAASSPVATPGGAPLVMRATPAPGSRRCHAYLSERTAV
jgi:hypothetical protein